MWTTPPIVGLSTGHARPLSRPVTPLVRNVLDLSVTWVGHLESQGGSFLVITTAGKRRSVTTGAPEGVAPLSPGMSSTLRGTMTRHFPVLYDFLHPSSRDPGGPGRGLHRLHRFYQRCRGRTSRRETEVEGSVGVRVVERQENLSSRRTTD